MGKIFSDISVQNCVCILTALLLRTAWRNIKIFGASFLLPWYFIYVTQPSSFVKNVSVRKFETNLSFSSFNKWLDLFVLMLPRDSFFQIQKITKCVVVLIASGLFSGIYDMSLRRFKSYSIRTFFLHQIFKKY